MRIFRISLAAGLMIPVTLLSKEYSIKSPDGRITLSATVAETVTCTIARNNSNAL